MDLDSNRHRTKKAIMKTLLKAIVIIFLISNCAYSKGFPDYFITKKRIDRSLKNTESIFVFRFYANEQEIKNQNIKLSYNDIAYEKSSPKSYIPLKVKPGKYVFQFYYNQDFREIITDSINIDAGYCVEVKINFKRSNYLIRPRKPVIYVYPDHTMQIEIKLNVNGYLGLTYPPYNNAWNFTADTDGTIHFENKTYRYLFWEGASEVTGKANPGKGFIVYQKDLPGFLEEKLSAMGLQPNEIQDFITYWCPIMHDEAASYDIQFLYNNECNEYAQLNITPIPQIIFRVYMLWSKIDKYEKIKVREKPVMQSFQRKGFTIVEWGGAEIKKSK